MEWAGESPAHGAEMANGSGLPQLSRDHYIPLRRQLAAALEAGIRDGRVRPGGTLPSSRDLARRLGIDRGTVGAALARLRRRNLIEISKGQRPRAVDRSHPNPATARDAALALLRAAHAQGLSRWQLLEELDAIVAGAQSPDPRRVTLLEPRPGLGAAVAAEIQETSNLAVRTIRSARDISPEAPVLVRRELLARLRHAGATECVPIALAGGTRERDLVARRVRRGLVVLLSRSETVRVFAQELAARDFGRGISFAALDPQLDERFVPRKVAAAALVFHDRLAAIPGPERRSPPTIPIKLMPRKELTRLCQYLSRDGRGARPHRGSSQYSRQAVDGAGIHG